MGLVQQLLPLQLGGKFVCTWGNLSWFPRFFFMITININVSPNSSSSKIIKVDEDNYRAKLKNPPIKGRANKELVELLAKYFKVEKEDVEIMRGLTGRYKVVRIKKSG